MAPKKIKAQKGSQNDREIMEAVASVKNGDMKASQAARTFKVKLSTLYDKLKGRYEGKKGASSILTVQEELRMVEWIEENAKMGQPISKKRFLDAALKVSKLHVNGEKKFMDAGKNHLKHSINVV